MLSKERTDELCRLFLKLLIKKEGLPFKPEKLSSILEGVSKEYKIEKEELKEFIRGMFSEIMEEVLPSAKEPMGFKKE